MVVFSFPVSNASYTISQANYSAAKEAPDRLLGVGMLAKVFRATATPEDGRGPQIDVAIKEGITDVWSRAIRREAERLRMVPHTNIIPLYTVMETDGGKWASVFPYFPTNLHSLCNLAPVSLSEACFYASQIFRGLCALKRSGLIHVALSPHVCLVNNDRLVISDFKRSIQAGQTFPQPITVSGAEFYHSPEQAFKVPTITPASDCFSAACIFAYMLLGTNIFEPEEQQVGENYAKIVLTYLTRVIGSWSASYEHDLGLNVRPGDRPSLAVAGTRPLSSIFQRLPRQQRSTAIIFCQSFLKYRPAERKDPMWAFSQCVGMLSVAQVGLLPHLSANECQEADNSLGQTHAKLMFGPLYP